MNIRHGITLRLAKGQPKWTCMMFSHYPEQIIFAPTTGRRNYPQQYQKQLPLFYAVSQQKALHVFTLHLAMAHLGCEGNEIEIILMYSYIFNILPFPLPGCWALPLTSEMNAHPQGRDAAFVNVKYKKQ